MLASVLEPDAGARDQIGNRPRDQDLGRASEGGDTGGDVHGHASDVVTPELDFAGVEARPQLDAQLSCYRCVTTA